VVITWRKNRPTNMGGGESTNSTKGNGPLIKSEGVHGGIVDSLYDVIRRLG